MECKPSPQMISDIFQWDVANWSKALPVWDAHLPKTGTALTLGERDGGLSLWLAFKGHDVVCTDLNGPTHKAKALHEEYEVAEKVSYASADCTDLPYKDAFFDIVMFKSMLGALETKERQQKAMDEMYRVLKPGGMLLFAENLSGTWMHQYARKRFVRWSAYWRYLHPKRDADLFNKFADRQLNTTGNVAAFGRSEKQRRFLSGVDKVISPLTPRSKRYILYGIAVKAF